MTNRHYQNYLNEVADAKKVKKKSEGAKYKELFAHQLKDAGLDSFFVPNETNTSELQFHPDRKWRFDFACELEKIAIELQGGGWGNVVQCHRCHSSVMRKLKTGQWKPVREGGRHQNPAALKGEYEKLNEAQRLGWRVFLFAPEHIRDKSAIDFICKLISPEPLENKG